MPLLLFLLEVIGKIFKYSPTIPTWLTMYKEAKVLGLTRISVNFQTRIPMDAVRVLKVKVGDKVVWNLEGGKVVVEKA